MKKTFVVILIFSLLTFTLSDDDDNNYTTEDIKIMQDLISKVLPVFKDILNDLQNVDSVEGNLLREILDKVYSILDMLSPLLDKDPQIFLEALQELGNKFQKLSEYFEGLVTSYPYDLLLNVEIDILTNEKIIKLLESCKDDVLYLYKKNLDEDEEEYDSTYFDIISEIYPNILDLLRSDDFKEFIKKCGLIFLYNNQDHSQFNQEYDVKELGEEAKQIFHDKIMNNEDYKKCLDKISEKNPYLSHDMINNYVVLFIYALVNNKLDIIDN